jgi:predicted ATPase
MITRIEVENFRSIKKASVDLAETNVLIGVNGAGKSTLIEALNFIKAIVAGHTIAGVARKYAPFGQDFFYFYTAELSAKFSIDVQTASDEKFAYTFSIGYNPNGNGSDEFYVISERLAKRTGDNTLVNVFSRSSESNTISLDSADRVSPELALKLDTSRLALATISEEDVKKVVETISSYEVIWFDDKFENSYPNRMIVDDYSSLKTIDDLTVSLHLKDEARFKEALATIKKIIPHLKDPDIVDLSESLTTGPKHASLDKTSTTKEQKSHRYFVTWGDTRYSNRFTRFSISGGNLRVIYLILSLYNSESKSCFIAEEVENGMHPSRIIKVVQILLQIAKVRHIQLVFSTHNYALTRELLPREVIFCTYSEGEGSSYRRLTDTEEFKAIKTALETEPSTDDLLESGLLFR